jgi:hypothetical protein
MGNSNSLTNFKLSKLWQRTGCNKLFGAITQSAQKITFCTFLVQIMVTVLMLEFYFTSNFSLFPGKFLCREKQNFPVNLLCLYISLQMLENPLTG